jgi:hypothetical protein
MAPAILMPGSPYRFQPINGAAASAGCWRLDAGEQLHLPCQAAAAVVTHPRDDVADQHVALRRRMCLGEHPLLAAPVTGDPQEP